MENEKLEPPTPQPEFKQGIIVKFKNIIFLMIGVLLVTIISSIIYIQFATHSQKLQQNNNTFSTEANNHLLAGNYKRSETIAKQGLLKSPGDKKLLKIAIDAVTSQGNISGSEKKTFEENKELIETADKIGQEDFDLLISIGYAYESVGDYEKALGYYKKALTINPNSAKANLQVGHAMDFLGRSKDSVKYYAKAYKLDPQDPDILYSKALRRLNSGMIEVATPVLLKIGYNRDLDTYRRAQAFTAAALGADMQGKYSDAVIYSENANGVNPDYSPGWGINGLSLVHVGQVEQGIKSLEIAIKRNPRISMNYLYMGVALRNQKNLDKAILFQQQGLDGVADDNSFVGQQGRNLATANMNYEIAETYSQQNNTKGAVSHLSAAFLEDPKLTLSITKDLEKGYFINIAKNPEFLAIVK